MEAKVVQMEKCYWRLDMFSHCLERHELKEPVVQLKMSFRSSRVVLTLPCSCFIEQPKWPSVSRINR